MLPLESRDITSQILDAAGSHSQALNFVDRLTRTDWHLVEDNKESFRQSLLHLGGYQSMESAIADIGSRTVVVVLAGGAAKRWDASFSSDDAQPVLKDPAYKITRGRPRGMALMPNKLPRDIWPHDTIPVFGYTLWQTRDIPGARRVIIHSDEATHEDTTMMQQTAELLGLQIELRPHLGRANNSRPSGHADAIVQNLDILEGSDFVLPQFVSDVFSPTTIKDAMLTLAVLNKRGLGVDVVVPTVKMDPPRHSIFIDNNGLVRKIGHAKLLGKHSLTNTNGDLFTASAHIGVYPFIASSLWEELEATYARYMFDGNRSYSFLPGHHHTVNEFAIDDAVLSLAAQGKVRSLGLAKPFEVTSSAKTVDTLPKYVQMMEAAILDSGLTPQT